MLVQWLGEVSLDAFRREHLQRAPFASTGTAKDAIPRFTLAVRDRAPGGTHGFGWHYDAEDVFIVQTAGRKDYLFRRNTIDPVPVRDAQPDFSAIRCETTPTMQCTLLAGDWLYLPRGTWHVARCVETSLSISAGVFSSVPTTT